MSKRRFFVISLILLTLVVTLISGCDNKEQYSLTVTVDPSGGGTTSPAVGTHDYDDGTDVNVTATAATGYVFDHWSGAVTGVNTSVSITMTANKNITANFSPAYQLTVNVLPAGNGNVTLSGGGPYKEDTKVTLTATPAAGYVFDHWSGAATGGMTPVTITMDANKTVTAHFSPAVTTYTLTVEVDPLNKGTVDISSPLDSHETSTSLALSYASGTQVTLTITPKLSSYDFLGWYVGSQKLGGNKTITITIDSVKTITAKIDCG